MPDGGGGMSTYLKKYYLDDRKLAQRALLEFYRAQRSGRMIAFTGAMTTQSFGYPGWDKLIEDTFVFGKKLISASNSKPHEIKIFDRINKLKKKYGKFDKRVAMSMLGEQLEKLDSEDQRRGNGLMSLPVRSNPLERIRFKLVHELPQEYNDTPGPNDTRLNLMEFKLANILRQRTILQPEINNIKSLWRDIGIERFATLNFDIELENMLMLTPEEQANVTVKHTILAELLKLRREGQLDWGEGQRITRILPSGRTVISDIISRERSDRLIDFAMGSDEAEQHIMHLHGRCDDKRSLIFSYRDYDRLYRRSDLHKLPFEYGQRIMIGGNPILFVGLGMGEGEVNRVLEDFISNAPYRRTAPTFLLWNSKRLADADKGKYKFSLDENANFRAEKLQKLGVFTIFDTDVMSAACLGKLGIATSKGDPGARMQNLHRLTSGVSDTARAIGKRERYVGKKWRSMAPRMASISARNRNASLWHVDYAGSKPSNEIEQEAAGIKNAIEKSELPVLFTIASAGWGKGQLSSILQKSISDEKEKKNYVLHVNAGFCFDTDSFLDGILRFFEKITGTKFKNQSRDAYFERINLCGSKLGPTYCVINGIDRFIDLNGIPLSAEFDRFIHQLLEDMKKLPLEAEYAPVAKWVFFGSDRTRLYLERLNNSPPDTRYCPVPCIRDQALKVERQEVGNPLASAYLQAIKEKMTGWNVCSLSQKRAITSANLVALNRSGEARRVSIERLRRAFFDAYLEPDAYIACGLTASKAQLAMEILRALAFIGLPTEQDVLQHVPRIFKRLDINSNGKLEDNELDEIHKIIHQLVEWKLVIQVKGFEQGTQPEVVGNSRYGLHRAVMAELRYRLGLPLSEAKLSTAFNMSLYVAQPVDGYIPEPGIHDELGELIDTLIVAYKEDQDVKKTIEVSAGKFFHKRLDDFPPYNFEIENDDVVGKFHRRCLPENVACLRAALAVVRGYYSTTGLLTLDRSDRLIGEDRDGILLEHAERLDDLIDAYGKCAEMRDGLRVAMRDASCAEKGAEKDKAFEKAYGAAEPFYPDELVWLHNERAVVRLAMGDLPEANRSFQKALTVNKRHVEYGDRSHNWRRIKLNQLTVEIEQGELLAAERLAREVLEASGWPIEKRVVSLAEAHAEFAKVEADPDKKYCLREDRLAIAISLGYRGMCANLRGEMLDACDDLRVSVDLLRELDEQRAFAYFARLLAWALREAGDGKAAATQLALASDAAQSTRQMDLVYRIKIMQAQWESEKPDAPATERIKAATMMVNAMDYGTKAGIHRVRTEAAAALSKLKLATGDHEIALQYAAEAMTIATRYVWKLRMMSIRVRLGVIMIERGDHQTGRSLVLGAIKSANRAGFQRIVDSAQDALDSLG